MRKVTVVRLGIAAALATMAVAGTVGSGCSNSSSNPSTDGGEPPDGATGPQTDAPSNGGDSSTPTDGGNNGGDSSTPTDAGKSEFANLIVAHTAPGVPPFRVCLAFVSSGVTTVYPVTVPLPDSPAPQGLSFPGVAPGTPGIYPGTIGALPSAADFSTTELAPFAILATAVANDSNSDGGALGSNGDGGVEEQCTALIGSSGLGVNDTAPGATPGRLTPGVDYFALPTIPANTLLNKNAYLLTVNGCLPGNSTAGSSFGVPPSVTCGPDYTDAGNVSLGVAQLDTTTAVPAGSIGIQFAHRSSAIQYTPIPGNPDGGFLHDPLTNGIIPAFFQPVPEIVENDAGPDGGDAGTSTTVGPGQTFLSDGGTLLYSTNAVTVVQPVAIPVALPADGGTAIDETLTGIGAFDPELLDPSTPWPYGDLIGPLPLYLVDALSSWQSSTASSPTGFQTGQTYSFIFEGDPLAQPLITTLSDGGTGLNPNYDGRGIHIVAFPNNFTAQALK